MKTIGIILREYESISNNKLLAIRTDLLEFLRRYPVQIICIPISFNNDEFEELKRVEESIKKCQGIILPGGSNNYAIDYKIVKYLYDNNIPTLGICLGMQLMALTMHGKIRTLENNDHQSKEEYVHKVIINRNSKLYKILQTQEILVNSRHNDYIVSTKLNVAAFSDDHIIEAVEDSNKKFFIGVQWHPESLFNDIYSNKIFKNFIECLIDKK